MFFVLLKVGTALGALSAAGFYVLSLLGAASFRRRAAAASSAARTSEKMPPVSLLKPLRGTDPHAYESLRSHCVLDYPQYEIIFGVADPADPAVALVERLIREFPARAIRLVICSQALGTNRKVSNLIQMLPHAAHEHLLINDSDIFVPRDYLRRIMAPFRDQRVGMVTCLYRGVPGRTLGSKLESLAISTEFFPGVLAALRLEKGMRFALGSTLAFPRRALAVIGGFEPLLDYLADDFELGSRIAAAGFEVVLADVVVETHLPNYTFADFFAHQLRWGRSTRDSRPWGYTGVLLTQGLPWALAALAASYLGSTGAAAGAAGSPALGATGSPALGVWWVASYVAQWSWAWGWLLLALIVALRLAVADTVGRKILCDRHLWPNIWLLPLRDLVGLAVWIGSYTGCRVRWREEEFILEKGRLRPI